MYDVDECVLVRVYREYTGCGTPGNMTFREKEVCVCECVRLWVCVCSHVCAFV